MPTRPLTTAVLATTLLAAGGCFFWGTPGSGTEASEDRPVDSFTEISISGVYGLEATVGPETSLSVTADDNILPLIKTSVSRGRLEVDTDGSIKPKVTPVIRVTAPNLELIKASGASTINASGITGEAFQLDTSGAARASLAGAVDSLEIDVSGASKIEAGNLTARIADVEVSGAGKVDVTVTDKLSVDVSGAGKVTYGGDPEVSKSVSGAGKVEAR